MPNEDRAGAFCALAYKAYRIDWMRRISTDSQLNELIGFYDTDLATGDNCFATFDEWIRANGYGESLYACMSEFLDGEFRDGEYIARLLGFDKRPDFKKEYDRTLAYMTDHDIRLRII